MFQHEDLKGKDLFKIVLKGAKPTAAFLFSYPMRNSDSVKYDTLELIKELLELEGDDRICAIPVQCYNPLVSRIYGGSKSYSIQIEALFIINQLYFSKPFFYSPYPVLSNLESGASESVNGPNVELAYRYYKEWYKTIKEIGLAKARAMNIEPLNGCKVQWY